MENQIPKQFYPKNREEWRKWLQKNHKTEKAVAMIRYKNHTGKPSLSHMEAMHEAICFGWIDTTIKRIDDEKYVINFRRRNEKTSKWSDNTLKYAKQMIKEGKMSPEGLKLYKIGLARPTHHHGIPDNPRMPFDLMKELQKQNALDMFKKSSPSSRRMHLRWLYRAKGQDTRMKRIKEIIEIVSKKKANQKR